ncbi:hypothetical protein H2203_007910 [Taxawa tesnikishii (nom. ined.)]|nr:hypothetical protein H2203_007910 [Dothideales sp. JES 119]
MEDELSPIQRAILTTLRINGGRTEQWISQKYHLPVTTIERVIRQATERAEGLGGALPLDSGVPDDPQPFDDTLRHNNNDDTLPRPNARLFSQFRQPAPTASIPAPLADATPFSPLLQPDAAPLDAAQHAASSSAEPNNSPQGPSFCTHHIDLTEGTTFPSFDAIRTLISMLSSTEGWEAQVSKRSKQRLVLNCRSSIGCPFHLHAKWDEVHSRALISILRPQHTCSQAPAHQRPTPIRPAASRMMFLLENVPKWLHVTSETSNKEIQDVVKARCGTEVRLQQCARLKTKLLGKRRMYMTKGPQGCSICGAQGHNARSCKNGGKKKWTWDERKAAKAEKRRAAVAAPKGQGMDADGRQGMDRGTKTNQKTNQKGKEKTMMMMT